MTNLLNKMVEVTFNITGAIINGKVVDTNTQGDILYVENEIDTYTVNTSVTTIKEIIEQPKLKIVSKQQSLSDQFENMLEGEGIEFDAYAEGDDITYNIDGYLYTLMISINEDGNHYCETTHKERFRKNDDIMDPYADASKAYGNRQTRKTLKGVMAYVNKWVNK